MPDTRLPQLRRSRRSRSCLLGLIWSIGPAGLAAAETPLNMPLPNLPALSPQPAPETGTAVPADSALSLARAEMREAQNRIGLSDSQIARLQQAYKKLAAGDSGGAFVMLEALNAQLRAETHGYLVGKSESLWHVAGQPQVYGNSYLWPLVWAVNGIGLKHPYQLYNGMHLTIPAHPTVQEAAAAIEYAKSHADQGVLLSIDPPPGYPASRPQPNKP
jgi:hypothetical protein